MPGVNSAIAVELLRILRVAYLQPRRPATTAVSAAAGSSRGASLHLTGGSRSSTVLATATIAFRSVVPEVTRGPIPMNIPPAGEEAAAGNGPCCSRWRTETMRQMFGKASAILMQHPGQ